VEFLNLSLQFYLEFQQKTHNVDLNYLLNNLQKSFSKLYILKDLHLMFNYFSYVINLKFKQLKYLLNGETLMDLNLMYLMHQLICSEMF
jgi:hypothetical protein